MNPDFETQVLAQLTQIERDLERLPQIEQGLESVKTDLALIKEEFKGWTTWLCSATSVILFGVAIALWRQLLV